MLQAKSCLCALVVLTALSLNLAQATTLNFEQVLKRAVDNSYRLKIAHTEMGISKTGVTNARADYFPSLQARASFEHLKGLQNQPGNVTSVGSTVIPSGTRIQNSLSISMNHTLTDFGVRKRKLKIAKEEVLVKATAYNLQLRDLKFKVIDAYAEALRRYNFLKSREAVLALTKDIYHMKKRLYKALTISKVDMAQEAIALAQSMDEFEEANQQLSESLESLSALTHDIYDPKDIELLGFNDSKLENFTVFNEALTPEAKIYGLQIQQKQFEVEYLKRQYLPQVSLYSYYNFYGFDQDHWDKAIKNIGARTISVGMSINMPIFDGLKNHAAIQKAKLEKHKLELERDEKLAELKTQAQLLESQTLAYQVQLKTKATILNKTQDKMSMLQRLSEQQVVDKSQAIKEHIQRIQRQLQLENAQIQAVVANLKLLIFTEVD